MEHDIDIEIRTHITNVLIECRKEKNITQAELAKVFDLKPTTVASWEQGKSLPSIAMLYRLAAYYKKTIGYMYGEKEDTDKLWQTRDCYPQDHTKQGLPK
jgi:transcriptional regulator with XRE-family HTH domain